MLNLAFTVFKLMSAMYTGNLSYSKVFTHSIKLSSRVFLMLLIVFVELLRSSFDVIWTRSLKLKLGMSLTCIGVVPTNFLML